MTTKDSAKALISDLVDRFEEQYDSYKKSGHNETLTRKDFIDPFFSALGWEMNEVLQSAMSVSNIVVSF